MGPNDFRVRRMPHVVYAALAILCPWPNCGFRIALVDFRLELGSDKSFYAQVMQAWGIKSGYGLIARCPGCHQYVRFGVNEKQMELDPSQSGLPVLPDDWHQFAIILSH
jgi:hypothetical protein